MKTNIRLIRLLIVLLVLLHGHNAFCQKMAGSSITTRTYTVKDKYISNTVYDNGLGDVIEEVAEGVTPNGGDLVTLHEYDKYRREIKTWLPAEVKSGGTYVPSDKVISAAKTNYSDASPFEQKTYDEFRYNNVASVRKAGDVRKNKPTTISNEIIQGIGFGQYYNNLTFSSSETYWRTRQVDEDGVYTEEWRDKKGNLKASTTSVGKTFYVHDDKGNLIYVVPPQLTEYLYSEYTTKGQSIWNSSTDAVKKYAYVYEYDGMNRCISKKLPGVEPTYYVYNKAGQCILQQDGNMRKRGEWRFTIPDVFGRECITGVCKNSFKYSECPLSAAIVYATRSNSGSYRGYSVTGLQLANATIHTINYYDDYDYIGKFGFSTNMNFVSSSTQYVRDASAGKGLLTGSLVACFDEGGQNGKFIYSAIYYDARRNVVQVRSTNLKGGIDVTSTAYTYTDKPLQTITTHTIDSTTKTECYWYTYDNAERLKTVKYSIADNASTVKTLAQNTYDFAGRLIRKERGNIRIQTLTTTYDYNILSAVTRIQTGTLFLERLHYGDTPDAYAGYSPKYNGGISSIEWTTDNLTRGYNYTYDSADRLTKAQYRDNQDININNRYTTTYAYDRNGNITKLTRRGKMADGTYDLVDDLTLKYNGNQLTKVTDAVEIATSAGSMDFTDRANVDNEYTYDANGNMTRDLNKGITSITYNVLNLPAKVTFSNGVTVMYTYDANGNKLKTIHKSATETHTTEYCGSHIYEDGILTRTLFDGGYITYIGTTPKYHYNITDHQGNIRLVVNASGSTVEQFTHYYPYGLPFAEGKNATLQPYKYNGKELDTEDGLNLYDYGARHYDAALCRWNA
ncbi:MAG: RHS repeat-associated core domain-containing protein, partial [Bacteroidales bacterium]|nr:RHS repeat-associated core domain-containing protein [Bacteroidales bacterium]